MIRDRMVPLALLVGAATATAGGVLAAKLALTPIVGDYELPKHPNTKGRTSIGVLIEPSLIWRPAPGVTVEGGALVRLPLALNFEQEIGALPVLRLRLIPLDTPRIALTFGSLDREHGWFAALVDEARYRYGRDLEEAYNRPLAPGAAQDLGGDPFLPAAHGSQLEIGAGPFFATAFLDWQLLESEAHREKFVFGGLLGLRERWFELGGQLRVVHYGGELETRDDPIRFAGLDPVRTLPALGAAAKLWPVRSEGIDGAILGGFYAGRSAQRPGAAVDWYWGGEIGAELWWARLIRTGYRFWMPRRGGGGILSEDSDPMYRQGRAHRVSLGLQQRIEGVEIDAWLDLVLPIESGAVQYLTMTTVRFVIERVLWEEE